MTDILSEYLHLSKLFGACIDYVQATGGNISVKDGDRIIIKIRFPYIYTIFRICL